MLYIFIMKNLFISNKYINDFCISKKNLNMVFSNFKFYENTNFKNGKNYQTNLIYLNSKQYFNNNLALFHKKQTYLTLENIKPKKYKHSSLLSINFYSYKQIIYAVEIGNLHELGSLYDIGYFKECFHYTKLNLSNYHNYKTQNRLKFTIQSIL